MEPTRCPDDPVEIMIEDHWKYVKGVLESDLLDSDRIDMIEYHYKTAMKHGFKHGVEAARYHNEKSNDQTLAR